MQTDYKVDSVRECTGNALRQTMSAGAGGSLYQVHHTEGFGMRSTLLYRLARSTFFADDKRQFPVLRMSLVLSMTITFLVMQWISPVPRLGVLHEAAPAAFIPDETGMIQTSLPMASSGEVPEPGPFDQQAPDTNVADVAPRTEETSSVLPVSDDVSRARNQVGVYLTASSVGREQFFRSILDDLAAASGSALVFDVKGGGALFHSAAPMANELSLVQPLYALPDIIRELHARGIYTIGRFVAIKDAGITGKLPQTRITDPHTGKVLSSTWVDPSDDDAIRYNMEILCEVAAAGIDEVNLDYIRFSTAEVGALRVFSGVEKSDRVEKFIRAARETVDRCGPQTKLGLSTFAILGWNYPVNVETLGQDVVRFAPLVDIISPMAYPATFAEGQYYRPGLDPRSRMYYLVYRTLTGYAELLGHEQAQKLRPWIQGYGVSTQDMTDQMDAVYDAGACGFTVWNASNAYAPAMRAMKKSASRPVACL